MLTSFIAVFSLNMILPAGITFCALVTFSVAYVCSFKTLKHQQVAQSARLGQHGPPEMYSSHLIAVGDYAAEIEKAVGVEIYTPIFRAGLLIFASGIISALITGVLVNSFDSWDALDEEFQAGKEEQLSRMDEQAATEEKKQLSKPSQMEAKEDVLDI